MMTMSLNELAILGGIWISLIYSATVMPATIWVIQLTTSRGWLSGFAASIGMTIGQLPWVLVACLLFFRYPQIWQRSDYVLRAVGVLFFIWLAYRNARAGPVATLKMVVQGSDWAILKSSAWRSMMMPWRFPVWAGLIITMGIHLRGPGWEATPGFTGGTLLGQLAWYMHFLVIAGLFGNRVPEDITLHSMNKLRLLATIVPAGLVLVILAPVVIE